MRGGHRDDVWYWRVLPVLNSSVGERRALVLYWQPSQHGNVMPTGAVWRELRPASNDALCAKMVARRFVPDGHPSQDGKDYTHYGNGEWE